MEWSLLKEWITAALEPPSSPVKCKVEIWKAGSSLLNWEMGTKTHRLADSFQLWKTIRLRQTFMSLFLQPLSSYCVQSHGDIRNGGRHWWYKHTNKCEIMAGIKSLKEGWMQEWILKEEIGWWGNSYPKLVIKTVAFSQEYILKEYSYEALWSSGLLSLPSVCMSDEILDFEGTLAF